MFLSSALHSWSSQRLAPECTHLLVEVCRGSFVTTSLRSDPDDLDHSAEAEDDAVEVGPEVLAIDMGSGSGSIEDIPLRHERPASAWDGPQLGDWDAIAGHDEGFPRYHGVDHLRVVVAQLSLGNGPVHLRSVGTVATACYECVVDSRSGPFRRRRMPEGTIRRGWQ